MTLYRRYAAELESLIATAALKPGERLDSVREASRRRGFSEATVVKAYHLLETKGLIETRERSGTFVCARRFDEVPQPAISRPSPRSTSVDKSDLIFEVLDSARKPAVVPLGSAFPSPLLFPLARLQRSLARGMRDLDPWRTVTDLTQGSLELRRLLAVRYRRDGIDVSPDELVITDGAMEALSLSLQAVTKPGDAVIIESPTFYVALQALERLGCKAIEAPTHPRDGVDVDALAALLARQRPAACWLMPTFQNPLGALMPPAAKRALVELLARHRVPLIEDDVYGELYYGERRPPPAKAFDRTGNVLHCGSFSKCLAPGYRVGWVAAGPRATTVQKLKLGSTLTAALPSQLALVDYLKGGGYDRHLRQLREAFRSQRDAMIAAIRDAFPAGTRITRPEGGYFLWVELPRGIDALALHRAALAESISVAPGALFSVRDRFANCLRINYGHPEDVRINRALRRLGALARDAARD
ncbi:MAG TPA: PLP-dependent aminotransferase family protein [Nevskiaceae bacterium]|nr:PLP-dependent aminotransferase family protein [Nevskiaceae bacterium]